MPTYRGNGAWGSGTGVPLTAVQFDGNTYEFDTRITELEENPPAAVSIDHFVVVGSLLTIILSDGSSHGPFVLPLAQWRWTGPWVTGVTYLAGDLTIVDGAVYFVRVMHVAAAEFDAGLFTDSGYVYIKVLDKPAQAFDIGMFWNDTITSGTDILMQTTLARDITIPANFATSVAFIQVATDVTFQIPIYRSPDESLDEPETEAVLLGYVVFDTTRTDLLTVDGGQYGVFQAIDYDVDLELKATMRITLTQPYETPTTAKQLTVTIVAEIPSL